MTEITDKIRAAVHDVLDAHVSDETIREALDAHDFKSDEELGAEEDDLASEIGDLEDQLSGAENLLTQLEIVVAARQATKQEAAQ